VRVKAADKKTAAEAVKTAGRLLSEAASDALRLEAQLVLAEAYKATGKYREARATFDEVTKKAPEENTAIRAAAYNGVGDCYRAQKKVQEAKWAYLRVRCVYFEETEQTPRAMEGLAWCFKQLRDVRRLRDIVAQIKRDYPGSSYIELAQKLLK